jgi:hypothetical protein
MITPEEANVLKPLEVEWLTSAEKIVDAELLAKFDGGFLRIRMRSPYHGRDVQILAGRYEEAGWRVESGTEGGALVMDFTSNRGLVLPRSPKAELKPDSPPEQTQKTAWDLIAEDTEK